MKLYIALTVVVCSFSGPALGCDPVPTMPAGFEWTVNAREHVHRVDIVFEGVALGRVPDDIQSETWTGTYGAAHPYRSVPTAFRVLSVWKGEVPPIAVVEGAPDWSATSCWSATDEFEPGERYLILASLRDDGAIESPRGNLVGLLETERAVPGRLTDRGWEEWQPSESVTNEWEAARERQQADWFEGAGDYRGVLDRMVAEGALPEPYQPRRFGESDRSR